MTQVEDIAAILGAEVLEKLPSSIMGYAAIKWPESQPVNETVNTAIAAEMRKQRPGVSKLVFAPEYDVETDGQVNRVLFW
jgi:hypothetical protein